MDLGKIPTLVVGLVVAILIVTVVAIPIIDDASKSINTEMQNSTGKFIVVNSNSTGTHTIEITETAVLWDGEPQQQYLTDYPGRCGSTEMIVINSMSTIGVGLQVWTGSSPTTYNLNAAGDKVTFANGTATIVKNGETVSTTTYNTLIMPSADGDYGFFTGTPSVLEQTPIYVDHGKPIYGIGGPYTSSTDYDMYIFSITDGNTNLIAGYNYNGSTISTKTYTITSTMTEGDLSDEYRGIKVDGTNAFYLFAPLTYHVITEEQSSIITIIQIIPILLIVSMLVAIVATIFVRTQ